MRSASLPSSILIAARHCYQCGLDPAQTMYFKPDLLRFEVGQCFIYSDQVALISLLYAACEGIYVWYKVSLSAHRRGYTCSTCCAMTFLNAFSPHQSLSFIV